MHYITGMHSYVCISTILLVCTVMAVYAIYYWYAQLWPYMHYITGMHSYGRICTVKIVCTVLAVYALYYWYAQLWLYIAGMHS
jgi:hypothetical protein